MADSDIAVVITEARTGKACEMARDLSTISKAYWESAPRANQTH
jgi:hypothetical protein